MEDLLLRLSGLGEWQLALAAVWLLLQGCVVPSVPEEVVITSLGMLAAQGRIPFPLAFLAILCGLLPANAATVWFGGRLARGLAVRGPFAGVRAAPAVRSALASLQRRGLAGGWQRLGLLLAALAAAALVLQALRWLSRRWLPVGRPSLPLR